MNNSSGSSWWDVAIKALGSYDNREQLHFQKDLAVINATSDATLRAAQLTQNVDAVQSSALQETLVDAVNVRNIALLGVAALLTFILVKGV